MRIGFVSIYSWRPHVEHLHYLASLARSDGHEVEFLTCDSDLPTCYTRELRNIRSDWQECLMCRVGGVRSYESADVHAIGHLLHPPVSIPQESADWGLSSASSLGRFESDADFASADFSALRDRLRPVIEKAYSAAINWINQRNLDAMVVFNGRIDATRAIFEAAKTKGIPVASLERTWFGDGLQILPGETCLGLGSIDRMVSHWSTKPLTNLQAARAANYIASRFLRRNQNEWRAYNVKAETKPWPANGHRRILLIPGSVNEVWGDPQWTGEWRHPTDAYDALINHLGLQPVDLVLRAHPNWGEKIGKTDGRRAEFYYSQWAKKRGVLVIPSAANVSTLGLIENADAVILSSGSAALEAGALGKQVIGIAGANYQQASIRDVARSISEVKALELWVDLPSQRQEELADGVRRKTLRFAYSMTHRIPQYTDYVLSITPTKYLYKQGGDPKRLINILRSGELIADDLDWSGNEEAETEILDLIKEKCWEDLYFCRPKGEGLKPVARRGLYRIVSTLRAIMPQGDR